MGVTANGLSTTEAVADAVHEYCYTHSEPLPRHIIDHAALTEKRFADADMMVSKPEAQFLIWFAKAMGAKRILEIGCFTGFSALGWAEAVKDMPDAKVVTLDVDHSTIVAAREVFKQAGVDHIVSAIEGSAHETLPTLSSSPSFVPFDLIFIDADKAGYIAYLNIILSHNLLRKGGVIIADNVLYWGLVAHDGEENPYSRNEESMRAARDLRAFNEVVMQESRVESVVVPVFDGLGMVRMK